MARRFAYLIGTVLLATLGIFAAAPAAWAHATLVSTSPAEGAIVAHAPARVTATFDEPVGVSADSLRVFAPDGSRVDVGSTAHGSSPAQIAVAVRPGLANGTYTVGWHVISADSHPVQGAFTFSVGAPSKTVVNPATVGVSSSPLVSIAFGVVRWIAFCSFALLIGAVGFVLWCWPGGASSPPVLRLTMGAWSGLAASVLAAVLLQGVYGAGQGLGHVFWPNVLHATLYSRYGRALGVRLVLVIVALFVFTAALGNLRVEGRRPSAALSATWGILAAALAATWAFADHAGIGMQVPLSVLSDTAHLCAVALWLGGLTMLTTIVLRRSRAGFSLAGSPASRRAPSATAEAARAVARFSPLALGCVCTILLTGTYQAWRGVGSWPALVHTTYGHLLMIKIGAMCVLIALGYLARLRVAALREPTETVLIPAQELVTTSKQRAGVSAMPGQDKPGNHPGPRAAGRPGADHRQPPGDPQPGRQGGTGGSSASPGGAAVTLAKLRWSVAAEALIAAAVLAVTAVLVNTPTAREVFSPPASVAAVFDTGGPDGRGSVSTTVTPAALGPNQVRLTVTGVTGRPYRPKQLEVFLALPARHLGPLAVPLTSDGPGQYVSGPVTVTLTGQWQLQITVRSDAFDETTVIVPVSIH